MSRTVSSVCPVRLAPHAPYSQFRVPRTVSSVCSCSDGTGRRLLLSSVLGDAVAAAYCCNIYRKCYCSQAVTFDSYFIAVMGLYGHLGDKNQRWDFTSVINVITGKDVSMSQMLPSRECQHSCISWQYCDWYVSLGVFPLIFNRCWHYRQNV